MHLANRRAFPNTPHITVKVTRELVVQGKEAGELDHHTGEYSAWALFPYCFNKSTLNVRDHSGTFLGICFPFSAPLVFGNRKAQG
jgi:hypothetical protein